MLTEEIISALMPVTNEEQRFLGGENTIDRKLYMDTTETVINSRKLLDKGKLISIRPHTRFVDFPEHTHDYVEVVYMLRGSTTHIINGKEIALKKGELLFLSQSARQEIKKAGMEDIAVNFIVLPEFFSSSLGIMGDEDTPLKIFIADCLCNSHRGSGYLHFKVSDVATVQNLVENLIYTLMTEGSNKRAISRLTMELLFLQLLNFTDCLAYDTPEEETVLEVLGYVETNYKDASLGEISRIVHMDPCYLSREIKRKTGKNFIDILQEKRLSQAAFYLRNTNMKVADISEAIGYENISYFHRLFYAKYGLSPKKYRDCK